MNDFMNFSKRNEMASGKLKTILLVSDKVQNVRIDLDNRKVFVTSELSADQLMETIKKTGKTTNYIGVAN